MTMNNKLIVTLLAAFIVVLGAVFVLWSRPPKGYSGKMESITIGTPTNESSALIRISRITSIWMLSGQSNLKR